MTVFGIISPGYEPVREAFASSQSLDAGGAQLAVYRHGVKVVDIWTGDDPVRQRPFAEDGITVVMSVTKGMTAIVAHLLAQRGLLDIDDPVAKYWPEFVQNGKEKITVRQLLGHTSGCAAIPAEATMKVKDLEDWDKIVGWLAEMEPFWEPSTAFFYHGFTFGYLIGEVVRRITGKTIGTYFHEEIAIPRGLNLWIGLPEDKEHLVIPWMPKTPTKPIPGTVAQVEPAVAQVAPPSFDMSKSRLAAALGVVMRQEADIGPLMDSPEGHAFEIPAGNGTGDARSLAKLYAAVIGEVDGKPRLLSEEILRHALEPQTDGVPLASPFNMFPDAFPLRFSLGFDLPRAGNPMLGESSFGHPGHGGRLAFAHIKSGITVGYVCNNPSWEHDKGPDVRWLEWLGVLKKIAEAA